MSRSKNGQLAVNAKRGLSPRLEQIKSAAITSFYQNGYAGTDLRTIAAQVGIHVSSLYNYIEGKEELLFLISKDGLEESNELLDDALNNTGGPLDQFQRTLEVYFSHHIRRRQQAWIANVEVRSLTGSRRREILRERKAYENRWREIVSSAATAGVISVSNTTIVVMSILSAPVALARWYEPSFDVSIDGTANILAEQLLNGLVPRQARTVLDERLMT